MPAAEADFPTGSRRRCARCQTNGFRRRAPLLVGLVVGVTALVALGSLAPSAARAATRSEPRVAIVVLAPYLTFSDLSQNSTPELWKLAQSGALGAMNARTADREQPNTASGALTISASRWASVPLTAPASANDLATLQALQDGSLTRPVLGSLGNAIQAAGGQTAAISVGPVRAAQPAPSRRPAELVAMDTAGHVDLSPAEGTLSATRRGRPTPRSTGAAASFTRMAGLALRSFAETSAPALLVVDSPRLAAASESPSISAAAAAHEHRAAVRELDLAVGTLARLAPAGTTILVLAPAAHKAWYQVPQFGPIVIAGSGFAGELTSGSTHRAGLVTNLDVAPTVLAALGVAPAHTMVGSPMTSHPTDAPLAERIAALGSADIGLGMVDQLREAWFIRVFVALALAVTALALWVVARSPRESAVRAVAVVLALVLCSIPSAAWLMFLGQRYPQSIAGALGAFAVATSAVVAVLLGVRWYGARGGDDVRGVLLAAASATGLTSVVIVADQWLAEPLRTGLFSYSVRAGWRYYGMGNEGAALLVGASLVAIGLVVELTAGSQGAVLVRRWAIPVVGTAVLFTAAAPFAGANAGVAVWGVVAYAAGWAGLNGIRPTLRTALITVALVAAAVVGFVAIDLFASGAGGTHLGKFALGILHGDLAATGQIVGRKLANNLGYFVATPYTLLFLALGGVYWLIRPQSSSRLRAALEPFSALRGVLLGAFLGGLLALVTEDSSSVMPALLWFAALMPTLLAALALTPIDPAPQAQPTRPSTTQQPTDPAQNSSL